jgi:hypothetical protein
MIVVTGVLGLSGSHEVALIGRSASPSVVKNPMLALEQQAIQESCPFHLLGDDSGCRMAA